MVEADIVSRTTATTIPHYSGLKSSKNKIQCSLARERAQAQRHIQKNLKGRRK